MLIEKLIRKNNRADMDTPWKHILSSYFCAFMEYCLPDIANQIDWEKGHEMLDKELNMIARRAENGNRVADKLVKIWTKDNQETWIFAHLEVQKKSEKFFPERMFTYFYRIRDYYHKPIISIAILIDGSLKWRPACFKTDCYGCSLEMRYLVVKLLDYKSRREELEKMAHPFAAVILAQLAVLETPKDPAARLDTKISLTRKLYEKGWEKKDILELYALIDWLIHLPKELELTYHKIVQQIEEEKQVRYITTAERIGRETGRGEGINEGLYTLLIKQLQKRFTSVPPPYVEHVQKADAETLLVWGDRVLDANTLEEVFA